MPLCIKCNNEKPQKEFVFHKTKQKYENRCLTCKSEYTLQNNKKIRKRNYLYISNIKKKSPCKSCNLYFEPCQLDFNHLDSQNKNFEMWKSSTFSIKMIDREISLCEILCANCHRIKTHAEFGERKENPRSCDKSYTDFINDLKSGRPCIDCRKEYPYYVMDFDHVRGEKSFEMNTAKQKRVDRTLLLEEIEKCDLVCVNCHRLRTFARNKGNPESEVL